MTQFSYSAITLEGGGGGGVVTGRREASDERSLVPLMTTSMTTPPLSISARPVFTRSVPSRAAGFDSWFSVMMLPSSRRSAAVV